MGPRSQFADVVWKKLQEAKAALASSELTDSSRTALRAALLSGGGSTSELPPGLVQAVKVLDNLSGSAQTTCAAIRNPLIAVAVECSRKRIFCDELGDVISTLAGAH